MSVLTTQWIVKYIACAEVGTKATGENSVFVTGEAITWVGFRGPAENWSVTLIDSMYKLSWFGTNFPVRVRAFHLLHGQTAIPEEDTTERIEVKSDEFWGW